MKIDFLLEINDALGKSSIKNDSISFLEFVKTFSFAGINSTSNPLQTLFRFLENIYGFAPSFIDHKFHLHPIKTENMFIDTDGIGLIINLDEIKHRIQTVSNKS